MRIWLLKDGEHLPIQGDLRPMRTWMLANALVARGHDVTWWSSTFSHQQKLVLVQGDRQAQISNNFRLELLNAGSYSHNISIARMRHHARVGRGFAAKARDVAQSCPPDLIVSAHPIVQLSYEAVRLGRELNIPVVLDIRDLWPDTLRDAAPSVFRPVARVILHRQFVMTRRAMRGCSAILASSESMLEWGLQYAGRTKTEFDRRFYLGYPASKGRAPDRQAVVLPHYEGKIICTYVGTFGASYELSIVCEAAQQALIDGLDNVIFLIAGKGIQERGLRKRFGHLPNLEFLGWLNRVEVDSLLHSTNVGLAPCRSIFGAAPNKIFEYLSHGIPVISSLEGEIADLLVCEDIGFSYHAGDGAALYNHIQTLARNPVRLAEMSVKALSVFNKRFEEDCIYGSYSRHLEEIAAEFERQKTTVENVGEN